MLNFLPCINLNFTCSKKCCSYSRVNASRFNDWTIIFTLNSAYSPGLLCMMPPSAKMVVAVM